MAKKKWEIWPVGIAVAMATFIGGIVFSVGLMMRKDVPLVADDYYAQEIAFQSRIDKEQRLISAGHKPEIRLLSATDALEIVLPSYAPGMRIEGKLTLYRPSNPSLDFSVPLQPTENGTQWLDLKKVDGGLWVLQMDWSENGESYYYEEKLTL